MKYTKPVEDWIGENYRSLTDDELSREILRKLDLRITEQEVLEIRRKRGWRKKAGPYKDRRRS